MLTPLPHQQEIVDLNPDKYGLWWGTGSGKTLAPIAWANKHATGECLVVMPNLGGMLLTKWAKAVQDFAENPGQWTLMTKEQFRRDYRTIGKYEHVFWDEAHAVANPKSQMHKALRAYLKVMKPETFWLMTATPYLADAPMSVLAYGLLMGKEWKFQDFRSRFYNQKYLGRGVVYVPKTGIEEELGVLMREIGSVKELKDIKDVPEHVFETEEFDMTPAQKKLRKTVFENESNPLVRTGKLHQIDAGFLIGHEFAETEYAEAYKNTRVLELAEEHKKLAVFSRYNEHLRILERILTAKSIPCAIINGDTKDKPEVAAWLESEPRAVALIQMQGAVGYELPSFTAIVFASLSYSYLDYVQSLGRFDRVNNELVARLVVTLLTKGGIDGAVKESLDKKQDFDAALFSNNQK